MGFVYADLAVTNSEDLALQRRGYFNDDEVRRATINMLADSSSYYTALNEDDAHTLGLLPVRQETLLLADGSYSEVPVLEPIRIEFAGRTTVCEAVLVPPGCDSLLGAIAMGAWISSSTRFAASSIRTHVTLASM
jgi:hypothetical protein